MAGLIISPRARIFQGHDWVYGTEVRKVFGNPQPGDVVALKDFKDRFLGSAMFNPHSQIVARRFSRRKQELNGDFFSRRISQAVELRRRRLPEETLTRLVWSESDGLPGLIVDRYADYLVVQTLTIAMECRLPIILNVLEDLLSPRGIIVRNDSPILAAEGISVEVIDLRTLRPLDKDTIIESVSRTSRAIIVHEACLTGGLGGEISSIISESDAFFHLDAPIMRVCGAAIPIPYNPILEKNAVPTPEKIESAVRKAMAL